MKEDVGMQDVYYSEVNNTVRSNPIKDHIRNMFDIQVNRCICETLVVLVWQDVLVEQLEVCVESLLKAERFELITHIARLLIPIYEKRHEFEVWNDAIWIQEVCSFFFGMC